MEFEYYVLNYDFHQKKVIPYNIFNNHDINLIAHELVEMYANGEITFAEFVCEFDKAVKARLWSRREFEISVGDAFVEDINQLEKWDCYAQVHPNIELVVLSIIRVFFEEMYKSAYYDEDDLPF
jgi:hypothetical protein